MTLRTRRGWVVVAQDGFTLRACQHPIALEDCSRAVTVDGMR